MPSPLTPAKLSEIEHAVAHGIEYDAVRHRRELLDHIRSTTMTAEKLLSDAELESIKKRDALMLQGTIDASAEWGNIAYRDRRALLSHIAALTAQNQMLEEQWAVMARACGNWREWPNAVGEDKGDDDWQAGARAIIERNEVQSQLDAARQELSQLYFLCFGESPIGEEKAIPALVEAIGNSVKRLRNELDAARQEAERAKAELAAIKEKLRIWARADSAVEVADKAANIICDLEDKLLEQRQQLAALSAPGEAGVEELAKQLRQEACEIAGVEIAAWSGCREELKAKWRDLASRLASQHRQQVADLEGRLREAEREITSLRQDLVIAVNWQDVAEDEGWANVKDITAEFDCPACNGRGGDETHLPECPPEFEPCELCGTNGKISIGDIWHSLTQVKAKLPAAERDAEAGERYERIISKLSGQLAMLCELKGEPLNFWESSEDAPWALVLWAVSEIASLRAELAQLRQRAADSDELQRKLDRAYTRIGELDWELGQKTIGSNPAEKLAQAERDIKHWKSRARGWRERYHELNQIWERGAISIAKDRDEIKADRDRLASDLATAKSRLAALSTDLTTAEARCGARERELERVRRACDGLAEAGDKLACLCAGEQNMEAMRQWNEAIEAKIAAMFHSLPSPAPAAAESNPAPRYAFTCPKCESHFFNTVQHKTDTKPQIIQCKGHWNGSYIGEKYTGCTWRGTWDEAKAPKSEPPPAPATQPDSPPAFRCPKCGGTKFEESGAIVACAHHGCTWYGTLAEVAAAKGGEGK